MIRKGVDPYYDIKVYHMADKSRTDGAVSALCYRRPRAINLDKGYSWTIIESCVTCPKCKAILGKVAA